jgi:hypothetical protein
LVTEGKTKDDIEEIIKHLAKVVSCFPSWVSPISLKNQKQGKNSS